MEVSLADGCLEGSEKDLCISALSMLGSRRGRQQVSEDPATKLSFCSKMPSCRFLTPAPPFTFCQADRCDLLVYLYRTKAGRKMHGLRPPMRLQTNMLREVLSPNRANSNACLKDSLGKHSNTMPLCNTQKLSIYKYKEIDRTSPCGPIGSPRIDSAPRPPAHYKRQCRRRRHKPLAKAWPRPQHKELWNPDRKHQVIKCNDKNH